MVGIHTADQAFKLPFKSEFWYATQIHEMKKESKALKKNISVFSIYLLTMSGVFALDKGGLFVKPLAI
jgi:hypothetical protein